MTAIGYVRQSRRADQDVAMSEAQQVEDIRRLAGHDGRDPEAVTIYRDLGRSGGHGKERMRAAYQGMLEELSAGGVEVIYAKALTRLGRSVTELYAVLRLAQEHGTRIHTAKEGLMDATTPIGKAQFGMLTVFAEFERDLAVERANDNVSVRRARGERMGRVPYGERPGDKPEAVLAAWHQSGGSLNETARILNGAGVVSWTGRQWEGPAVRLVLNRLAPGLLPDRKAKGVKPSSPFLLYRLVICPACDRPLTASRDRRHHVEGAVYRCHRADVLPDHPPMRVREAALMPWIRQEAARFRVPADALELDAANEAERSRLEGKRARVIDAYTDGAIDKLERDRRLAVVDEELADVDETTTTVDLPQSIDWDGWSAEAINRVLSAYWSGVRLDLERRPIGADWRFPPEYVV